MRLIFHDWISQNTGESIYNSADKIHLTSGDFHSGTTFTWEELQGYQNQLKEAKEEGALPVFLLEVGDA